MRHELVALDADGRQLLSTGLRALPERIVRRALLRWAAATFDRMPEVQMVHAICPEHGKRVATVTRAMDTIRRAAGTRAATAELTGRLYSRADLDLMAREVASVANVGSACDWYVHLPAAGGLLVAVHDRCTVEVQALGD